MRDTVEHGLEKTLFASRWLLAPMYVGLLGGLLVVLAKFFQELWHLLSGEALRMEADQITVAILSLIDIALVGNLIIIVIFAGYENFVSRMHVAHASEDQPSWMGHVDFSGLKMKLIGSLVAISAILLLKDFVAIEKGGTADDYEAIAWRIGLHFTFVLSGVLFALMDYWGAKRQVLLADAHSRHDDVEDAELDRITP
ncbi:TIGR00645 family protein [Demequina silvatica]|uniref:TIGR00645 family protein n=1 Tax=Demequina silvatica TaxID=1638988 RepID=UPI0007867429|nr:TIGR00645 family protein [Demequina silvatica]